MSRKKFTESELRDAIIMVFGSIDDYAKTKDLDKANIYQKIKRQSPKFIKELRDNGVTINEGVQIGSAEMNNNKGNLYVGSDDGIEKLKSEIEMLKEIIKSKDKIIALLESKQHT